MRTRFEDHAVGSLQVCCLYKINLPFLFFFGGRYFLNGIINHEYNYIMKETFIGSIIGKKNVFLQVWLYTLWPNGNWTCLNCTCSFPITNHMLAAGKFFKWNIVMFCTKPWKAMIGQINTLVQMIDVCGLRLGIG